MVKALSRLPAASPLVEILCVGTKEDIDRINANTPPWIANAVRHVFANGHHGTLGTFPHPLNEEQRYQIRRALENPLSLIQGPPGT